MARPAPSIITQADIQEYLNTQDNFALELFVYNEAVKAELVTTHAGTYEDPATKKHRQFDVRASRQWRNRRIDLAVECKALRSSFPLLISRVPRSETESSHSYIESYRPGGFAPGFAKGGDSAPASSEVIRPSQSIYPVNGPVGKSMTQVGRNGQGELTAADETFDKWSQALSSASTFVESAWHGYEQSTTRKLVASVIPVLVVSDGTLWVADYRTDGTLERPPSQEGIAELYVDREFAGPGNLRHRISHLHILTKSEVPKLFRRIATDEAYWNTIFPPEKFPNDGALATS